MGHEFTEQRVELRVCHREFFEHDIELFFALLEKHFRVFYFAGPAVCIAVQRQRDRLIYVCIRLLKVVENIFRAGLDGGAQGLLCIDQVEADIEFSFVAVQCEIAERELQVTEICLPEWKIFRSRVDIVLAIVIGLRILIAIQLKNILKRIIFRIAVAGELIQFAGRQKNDIVLDYAFRRLFHLFRFLISGTAGRADE